MTTQNQTIRKILIAPDKFKGSLTSLQAASAIKRGMEAAYLLPDNSCAGVDSQLGNNSGAACALGGDAPHSGNKSGGICAEDGETSQSGNNSGGICAADGETSQSGNNSGGICAADGENPMVQLQFQIVEIADGGDGSLDVVAGKVDSPQLVSVEVHDPLFRKISSQILLYGGGDSPLCAFIEMAKISGLAKLEKSERNPLKTSTYGLGEAICIARQMGARKITLSIGGSATDDCGAGMLQALGFEFFNCIGELMPVPICGNDLQEIARIDLPDEPLGCRIEVICDVDNPLLGENGATAVYAPQKGATPEAMEILERGKANMAAVAEECLHIFPQMKLLPGAGAAGGVGYAGTAFLGGKLLSGWRFFTEITSLEEKVQWADVVVTGEGSVDSQSLSGKIVGGIMELARKWGKPVEIFCGISSLQELPQGVRCHSLASIEPDLQVCMTQAAELLDKLAYSAANGYMPD